MRWKLIVRCETKDCLHWPVAGATLGCLRWPYAMFRGWGWLANYVRWKQDLVGLNGFYITWWATGSTCKIGKVLAAQRFALEQKSTVVFF